ncbi:hypothetical protein SB659_11410 [Arthrobacter sp. SIMBA_036]|uniref:hypothetical protein n=1 Tax=Arthrobacter sp. SIMBA_036 TaxID=3085778 RepID=UPI0039799BCC
MSEETARLRMNDEQAIDRLLADADACSDDLGGIRSELLELRSWASTPPSPSAAVRALMVSGPAAATSKLTTADGPAALSEVPTSVLATVAATGSCAKEDELAARRRRKRRTALAGFAVAATLAGGATAAAASEGGIPAVVQHVGAAIGSVVSQLAPTSGKAPRKGEPAVSTPDPLPVNEATHPAPARGTAPANPGGPSGAAHPDPRSTPGEGASRPSPKASPRVDPGNLSIPSPPVTAPVTPPGVELPPVERPAIPVPASPAVPGVLGVPTLPTR